ncbi:MAG: 50S ribosomal protein L6 [archaeon]
MMGDSIEREIVLPAGFVAEINGTVLSIKGMGKEASRQINAKGISLRKDDGKIVVVGKPASRKMNAVVSTIASHVGNMVSGLECEFVYRLGIVYSHFPMNVSVKGDAVEIKNFVGEKKPRIAKIVAGASVTVKGKDVFVRSHNKEAAGQTAANLERASKVKGKDKRIYQDGIFIIEKALQEKKESN